MQVSREMIKWIAYLRDNAPNSALFSWILDKAPTRVPGGTALYLSVTWLTREQQVRNSMILKQGDTAFPEKCCVRRY